MTSVPVNNPAEIWAGFHGAVLDLVHHPLANRPTLRGEQFAGWQRQAFRELGRREFQQAFLEELSQLEAEPLGERSSALILMELEAFTGYVGELLPQWDVVNQAVQQVEERGITMPVPDTTGVEESHSVLSTVLDSLMELFPKLKGIFKACSEALAVKKAMR